MEAKFEVGSRVMQAEGEYAGIILTVQDVRLVNPLKLPHRGITARHETFTRHQLLPYYRLEAIADQPNPKHLISLEGAEFVFISA